MSAGRDQRRRERVTSRLELPSGWSLLEVAGVGPFPTSAVLERPDGTRVEWTSRRDRKHLGLQPLERDRSHLRWSRPAGSALALGLLFAVGSACFAVGTLPGYVDSIGATAVAWTFFVGSLFFTSAGYGQFHEAGGASDQIEGGHGRLRGLARVATWQPHRIDWWSSTIQLVGTVWFNVSTFAATREALEVVQERRWIWAPDVFGSVCFLVASWMAFVEVDRVVGARRGRGIGWWIAAVNLVGSIAFGVSAVAARYVRSTGEIANMPIANLGTLVGAVCFLLGALALPIESARDRSPR